jgi:large subunit ribosomal protein L9
VEVILQQDVEHLGAMGEVVKVKPGFARNYLFPRGLALEASSRNLSTLAHQKVLIEAKRQRERKSALGVADKIEGLVLEVRARAGEEDRLYGSVTNIDIERALGERGIAVERRRIDLDDPIKRLGIYRITVGIVHDVKATFTLKVLPESDSEAES